MIDHGRKLDCECSWLFRNFLFVSKIQPFIWSTNDVLPYFVHLHLCFRQMGLSLAALLIQPLFLHECGCLIQRFKFNCYTSCFKLHTSPCLLHLESESAIIVSNRHCLNTKKVTYFFKAFGMLIRLFLVRKWEKNHLAIIMSSMSTQ